MTEVRELKQKGMIALSWDFAGKLLQQGTLFAVSVLLARLLDPSDFGLLGMAMAFSEIFSLLRGFGFDHALIQKPESTQTQKSTIFFVDIVLGVLVMVLILLGSRLVARFYGIDSVATILIVISSMPLINALSSVHYAIARRALNFKVITQARFFASVVSGAIGVTLALKGFGVWALVIQTLVSAFLRTLFIWRFIRWRPSWTFDLASIREHWIYGYKLHIAGSLNMFFARLDVLVIGKVFSADVLGQFFRAKSFNQLIVKYGSASLGRVMFPVFSQLQSDPGALKNALSKTIHVIAFFVFGLMGVMFLNAEPMIVILFTDKWMPAVGFFQILVFSSFVRPMASVYSNVLRGTGASNTLLKLEVINKVLLVGVLCLGVVYGIDTYLYGLVVAGFVELSMLLGSVAIQIQFDLRRHIWSIGPYSVISLLLTLGFLALLSQLDLGNWSRLLLVGLIFPPLYVGVAYVLKLTGCVIFFRYASMAFSWLGRAAIWKKKEP